MTDTINPKTAAQISALIDQQGTPRQQQEALQRVLADDHAGQVWQRYHLIGSVLRGEVEQTGADLSARIRARVAAEPTVLAPAYARLRTTWKTAGLLALAASVVLAVVLAVNPTANDSSPRIASNDPTQFAAEVGKMLAQHAEFTSSPGLNGLVVYAKMISNESIDR